MSPVGDRATSDGLAVIPGPPGIGRLVPGTQGHQQVPGRTVLQYHVRVDDRQIDILLPIHEHPVGGRQHPFAPGGEEGAIPVEHDQGMRAPIEQIDPVAGICHDAGLAQGPASRKLCPIFHQRVGVCARPYCGHLRSLLSMESYAAAAGKPMPLCLPSRAYVLPSAPRPGGSALHFIPNCAALSRRFSQTYRTTLGILWGVTWG
jgi:hypothetical protein